jgi:hypothetical protein
VGGFNLGGHGVKVVGSRVAVAGGLGDPAGGERLRPRRPQPPPRWHDINGYFGIVRLVSASIADTNNIFTADTLDPFCSSGTASRWRELGLDRAQMRTTRHDDAWWWRRHDDVADDFTFLAPGVGFTF